MTKSVEWSTLSLVLGNYGLWALGTSWLAGLWLPLGVAVTVLTTALYSSLCHEAIHGHPFRRRAWNEVLMFPSLSLCIPYGRFRDLHLAHHHDERLTDPYDDPESNYLDPEVWTRQPGWWKAVRRFNNTLFGRLLIGPVVGNFAFFLGDFRAMARGERPVIAAWAWNAVGIVPVVLWLSTFGRMPVWAFLAGVYMAMSVLKIRTFLEHRAHLLARGRTVIIEDRGLLAFLFLNNNFHVVHHVHPNAPWHVIPALYRSRREQFLARNEGYRYASYAEVFRRYFWKAKDPVPHPLWKRG